MLSNQRIVGVYLGILVAFIYAVVSGLKSLAFYNKIILSSPLFQKILVYKIIILTVNYLAQVTDTGLSRRRLCARRKTLLGSKGC